MARTKRILPQQPDLPAEFDEAPAVLESRDSWFGVAAGEALEVDDTVADAELIESTFTGVDLSGRTFTGLRARDVVFDRCDLSGATLDGASLDRVVLTGCRLTGTMLSAASLQDVVIRDCVANLANLRASRGRYLWVERTNLTEADLYTAQLTDSAILDCDLTGANVTDVRVERLALHGSTLERLTGVVALRGASIDDDQVIPLGVALVAGLGITTGTRPG